MGEHALFFITAERIAEYGSKQGRVSTEEYPSEYGWVSTESLWVSTEFLWVSTESLWVSTE